MRNIPCEIRIHIAKFLSAPDLKNLCASNTMFMKLGQDEQLFRLLYERDFHINNIPRLNTTFSWKQIYTTIYLNKMSMILEMRKYYGLIKSYAHRREYLFFQVHHDENEPGENPFSYIEDCIGLPLLDTHKKTLRFDPDNPRITMMKINHMNIMHQVYLINQELGRNPPEEPYERGPPSGESSLFLAEGICFWNTKTEVYDLIYPLDAFRNIYQQCYQQVSAEHNRKVEYIKNYLQQILVLTYKVEEVEEVEDIENKNMSKEISKKLIFPYFSELDLHIFEYIVNENKIQISCSRSPKWTYNDKMCIYHANTYDEVRKAVEINCTNLAVNKEYCDQHKADNYHLKKSHRKYRQKLRNQEYLNYSGGSIIPSVIEFSGKKLVLEKEEIIGEDY